MAKLPSEARRVEELKEQIRIRVVGFGWTDLHTPWSKKGEPFKAAYLLAHLAKVIDEQAERTIPAQPPVPLSQRKELPQLGTATLDVLALNAKAEQESGDFEAAARAEKARREAEGIGDAYENKQPVLTPEVVVGMRVEVLFRYDFTASREEVGGSDAEAAGGLMWCPCTVLKVDGVRKGPRSMLVACGYLQGLLSLSSAPSS